MCTGLKSMIQSINLDTEQTGIDVKVVKSLNPLSRFMLSKDSTSAVQKFSCTEC